MRTLALTLLLTVPFFLHAQYSKPARAFGAGQVDLQAAVGLFPTYLADRPESVLPPLQLGVRWLVSKNFSLGAVGGYSTSRSKEMSLFDSIRGRWENTTYFLGLQNGFHYTQIEDWGLYGGFCLLYQYAMVSSNDPDFEKAMRHTGIQESSGKMALTAYIGTRFALSAHASVFTELGYGISLLKVGVGYKL
ncbi:MAG: hypothetical protein H6564_22255 [Lewinellaceae bacterium]|nr:hypothetical protein [Lewinellaceae bacterium]